MNLNEMIAAERSAPAEATKAETNEVWLSIEQSFVLGTPSPGVPVAAAKATTLGKIGAALSTTSGKVLLATALVTGGAVGVDHLTSDDHRPSASDRESEAPVTVAVPGHVPAHPAAGIPQAALPVAPEPTAQASVVPSERTASLTRQTAKQSKPAAARPPEKPKASVHDELALIRRMQSAVRSGAYARALALTRQHATTYPQGAFVEDRDALRTLALCQSGRASGPAAATTFRERWPKSMHKARIAAACK